MAGTQAVIKNAEMNQIPFNHYLIGMQQHAIDCAAHAFEIYRIQEDIAKFIKSEFDTMYQPSWHCIVGKSFGSYFAHQTNHMINFYIGEIGILLWRTVQK